MNTKYKVIVISNLIYPLRDPVFKLLDTEKKIDFKFFFLRKTLNNRKWEINTHELGYKHKVLAGLEIPIKGHDYFALIINPTILFDLFKERPKMIISIGWAYPANFLALLYSKLTRKKFILWNESTNNEKSWRRSLASPVVKFVIKNSDGFITSGTKAKQYLEELGADSKKIKVIGNAINNEEYKQESDKLRKDKNLKKRLGFNDSDFLLTYIGRFEKVKGLDMLLDAFKNANDKIDSSSKKINKNMKLLLIGYGPEKNALEDKISQLNLKNVYLLGPFERDELIPYYTISDFVLLPSYSETWGYTINESLACSTPVIVSSAVGSSTDLVKPRVNGYIFPKGDINKLSECIKSAYYNQDAILKESCYNSISEYNYPNMASNITEIISQIKNGNGKD